MAETTTSFGLCSASVAAHVADGKPLNYEHRTLVAEAEAAFDEVFLIDPQHLAFEFHRGRREAVVLSNGHDISRLSCLVVRGTHGHERAVSALVRALRLNGCAVVDPMDRFSGDAPTKLLTTIERFERSVGTDSYFAFSLSLARALIERLAGAGGFPLLFKPIEGKQGRGVAVLPSRGEAERHARRFFSDPSSEAGPWFVQPFVAFEAEFRVMVVGERVLGVVQKRPRADRVAANISAGGTVVRVEDPEVARFTLESVEGGGVLGVDVGRDGVGRLHVIEANRAPLWKEFEQATGVNVAREVIRYARGQCEQPARRAHGASPGAA